MSEELSARLIADLRREAQWGFPNEICGFVMRGELGLELKHVPNVSPRPEHNFRMSEEGLLAALEEEDRIVGVYHSHPHGPPQPSDNDKKYATPGFRQWIVTLDGVHEWENPNG